MPRPLFEETCASRAAVARVLIVRSLLSDALLLVAGGISALGFAPLNLWPLTFLAISLLVDRLVRAPRLRDAGLRGWMFGIGHFVVGLTWIAAAFTHQAKMPARYGWISVVLLSLYLALFPALAAVLAWKTSHRNRFAFAFMFAVTWMLCEWLRASLFTGFSWNPTGAVWLTLPWIAQSARWIGTYGLSALVILGSSLFWLGLQKRALTTVSATMALVLLLVLPGRAIHRQAEQTRVAAIPIRIVQPNIGQDEKNDAAQEERHAEEYARLSGKPTGVPRLLFWPEAATLKLLELQPKARANLAALLGPDDILITGGESVTLDPTGGDNDIYHNSVFALDSRGVLRWRYDKAHLVPFGEYLPARPVLARLGLSRLVPGDGDFSFGPGPRTFPLTGFQIRGVPATMGVQICYEIIFSGRIIDAAHRPAFLFNPSNDAWFGAWGPPQHLAQAQLRAIEEGLPVIRATPNGISAVISPTGQLMATIAQHRAGVIDAFLPEPQPPTIFSRFGLWTCAVFGLCLGAIGLTSNLRSTRLHRSSMALTAP